MLLCAELRPFWWRTEEAEPLLAADEIQRWPVGTRQALTGLGLLREAGLAAEVTCYSCGRAHGAAVFYPNEEVHGRSRPHIVCPEDGLIEVEFDDMRQWLVDRHTLAAALNANLDLAGMTEPVVPDRIWALGRRQMAGRFREFFLVCGANCRDAQVLGSGLKRILDATSAVVFVPDALPRGEGWKQPGITVLRLSQVAHVEGGALRVDTAFVEDILHKDGPRRTLPASAAFPTPQSTAWEEIRLLVGDLSLKVEVRGIRREFDFQQLGFANKRSGGLIPNAKWEFLLLLARFGGVLPFDDARLTDSQRSNLKNYVKNTRDWMQAFFGLERDDPLPANKELRRYECRVQIAPAEGVRFPTPPGANWSNVSVREARQGSIMISVDAVRVKGATHYDAAGRRLTEAAVDVGSVAKEYDLTFLGLMENRRPTAVCKRLLEVLRKSGRITASEDDAAMLELSRFLCSLMQIDEAPFRFTYGPSLWSAQFDAVSFAQQ
ncbi:MAG: hypothetical protein IT167_18555 [Bryobacterales bacterium]|nr:hypothetical protein [Bryobacterales bacterium]